jgi:DNA-binding NarL/FixJ family response regulator
MSEGATSSRIIRVFLLDDHEVVRVGLISLLEAADDISVVGQSASAKETLRRLPSLRPDVAILDARLPDGYGIEVCRAIRAALPDTYVLMLTSYRDDEALLDAVLAGASGYLLKEIRSLDLVAAVRTVSTGRSLLDPDITRGMVDKVRANGPEELMALTSQERKILELIAQGMTNRQIGQELFLAEKTVKNYVSSVLTKLGLERRTQAAVLMTKLAGQ